MNRQFQEAPLTCPNCGYHIGTQAYYQTFEAKTALWMLGEMAPSSTKGFDVWRIDGYPDITIQVKFANAYTFQSQYKKYPTVNWTFNQKRLDPRHPDYFVFFGLYPDGEEHCFLLSRQEFIDYACVDKQGYNYLRVSAKKKSDRQNYNYVPKIWQYEVINPAANLRNKIIEYENCR